MRVNQGYCACIKRLINALRLGRIAGWAKRVARPRHGSEPIVVAAHWCFVRHAKELRAKAFKSLTLDERKDMVRGHSVFFDERTLFGLSYGDLFGNGSDLNMVTVGANYYLAGNNAKLSVDWSWSFDQVVALGSGYGYTNWLPSGNNGGEWMLRTQLQLMF